jgi:C-terminal processing protease CtpA/Prc
MLIRRGRDTTAAVLILTVTACSSTPTATDDVTDAPADDGGAVAVSTTSPPSPAARATTTTAATGTSPTSTSTTASPVLAPDADAYLQEALSLMREWSINRDDVDWEAVERLGYRVAAGAETPAETYGAIKLMLRELRDDHSTFFSPAQAENFGSGPASFDEPVVELRHGDIGYVSLGRYSGDIGDQADAFAAALAAEVSATMSTACGWIVDLRRDSGGNMWPMIGGLAPLLGEGEVGSFVYPNGVVEPWVLEDGVAYWSEMPMTAYGTPIPADQPPVAVLIGDRTASAGEATTVAFGARPDTRFFGRATAGLTTANEPLALSDGALLMLTMSVFTDRAGRSYGQDIAVDPDVAIDGDPDPAAVEWLRAQPGCGG